MNRQTIDVAKTSDYATSVPHYPLSLRSPTDLDRTPKAEGWGRYSLTPWTNLEGGDVRLEDSVPNPVLFARTACSRPYGRQPLDAE